MYLPWNASRARMREAENARRNRAEILQAWSQGRLSRRDLMKLGLFTAAGTLVLKNGLSPFARSAYADDSSIPTGLPRSPLFGVQAFTQPMPRFDVLPRTPISALSPAPTAQANTTQQALNPALEGVRPGDTGPIEGRPPGPIWAHQEFTRFAPAISIQATQEGAKVNSAYNPGVTSAFNSGINAAASLRPTFHPSLPDQGPLALWTFNGTLPPKLMQVRYGEPVLFRHRNQLPFNVTQNGGFGRHTITIHEHNGHHGAENDGFTGAYFFPGQFYDYHYPIVLAGWRTINSAATDPRAGGPDDNGGIIKVPGDWQETMSSHWFHDHMFSFTSQNVYKGMAGMFNIYSALDRGNEALNDGVNLRLPSGTAEGATAAPARTDQVSYAFNVDTAAEGNLQRATRDDIESAAPGAKLHSPGSGLADILKERRSDLSESPWLFLLLLLVLIAEQAMAVRLSYHLSGAEMSTAVNLGTRTVT